MSKETGVLKGMEGHNSQDTGCKKPHLMAHADDDDDNNFKNDNNGSGKPYHAKMVLPNGDYSTGQWSDNFPLGQGKYLWTASYMCWVRITSESQLVSL
jgi:hypothetical protein